MASALLRMVVRVAVALRALMSFLRAVLTLLTLAGLALAILIPLFPAGVSGLRLVGRVLACHYCFLFFAAYLAARRNIGSRK